MSATLLQNLALTWALDLGNVNSNLCSKECLWISFKGDLEVRNSLLKFEIAPCQRRQQKKDPDQDQVCLLLGIFTKRTSKCIVNLTVETSCTFWTGASKVCSSSFYAFLLGIWDKNIAVRHVSRKTSSCRIYELGGQQISEAALFSSFMFVHTCISSSAAWLLRK